MYNYSQFLAKSMHEQLMNLTTEGVFKYSSILFNMFIFQQGYKFPIFLHKKDDQQENQAVIHLTSLITKNSTQFKFSNFIDCFIHPIAQLLSSQNEPRMSIEIKGTLHLNDQVITWDWYLYKNYTEIKVYGYELEPYKLPKYVPMRILSLENIRQMINMDELHFISGKRRSEFKIKARVGSFICNIRSVGLEVNAILK